MMPNKKAQIWRRFTQHALLDHITNRMGSKMLV